MTRCLLSALLVLSAVACDHQVGTDDFPPGNTTPDSSVTSGLRAVFAVSDEEVYMVGEEGTVLRFDGQTVERISVAGVGPTDVLWDVAAADPGEVVAIGGTPEETPLLVTLHGGAWTAQSGPPQAPDAHFSRLLSTLHFGFENPHRVVLAGGRQERDFLRGHATSYADGTFTALSLGDYHFFEDVTGIGATLYFRHMQGLLAYDAGRYDLPGVPTEVNTNVLGLSEGRDKLLFGFSGDGRFHTLRNDTWTSVQTELQTVQALDGRASNDLYAVGGSGGFFHYDGTAWTALESGTTEHLRDVHVLPNGHVFVVGDNGTFFRYVP